MGQISNQIKLERNEKKSYNLADLNCLGGPNRLGIQPVTLDSSVWNKQFQPIQPK